MARLLSVMSFNIWRSGGRSLDDTIEVLREIGPDVVGLQECVADVADKIADALDLSCVTDEHAHAILTRGDISRPLTTRAQWGGLGATIDFGDGTKIHFFDAHLHWDSYGPYHLKKKTLDVAGVLAEEERMRMPGLEELFRIMDSALASPEPAFLVGDFNAPSHLDYPDIAWPTSIACEKHGLTDAFREVNRDPGITWSPIPEEEPHGAHDRIDFVHYTKGKGVVATRARTIDGASARVPWPSDHRAVVVDFTVD